MATKKRRRREYLVLLDKAKEAAECAIDNFNRTKSPFRSEATLILLSTAWELLAKAVLVQMKESINTRQRGNTISAEVAVNKLLHKKRIQQHESDTAQQIISLRNAAAHSVLPDIPLEVQHHLMYYASKFFRDIVQRHFPTHAKDLEQNYLCLSFSELTTYADKVQKCISKMSKSDEQRKVVWLLERGLAFDGTQYMTERQFKTKLQGKTRKLKYLEMGRYLNEADMVRVVPVEAPKNYTADVNLRKGDKRDSSLPVVVKKSDANKDYPYLTSELAQQLGKSTNYIAKLVEQLGLKGDDRYHHAFKSSRTGTIQKYSQLAKDKMQELLVEDPNFNPYRSTT